MVRISSSSMSRGLALALLIGLGMLMPLEALTEEDRGRNIPPDLPREAGGRGTGIGARAGPVAFRERPPPGAGHWLRLSAGAARPGESLGFRSRYSRRPGNTRPGRDRGGPAGFRGGRRARAGGGFRSAGSPDPADFGAPPDPTPGSASIAWIAACSSSFATSPTR